MVNPRPIVKVLPQSHYQSQLLFQSDRIRTYMCGERSPYRRNGSYGRADNESPIHIGSIATLFEIITNERTGSNQ